MPLVDRFEDGDVTQLVQTGDTIRVDPETGQVTILWRRPVSAAPVARASTQKRDPSAVSVQYAAKEDRNFAAHLPFSKVMTQSDRKTAMR